MDLRVLFLWLPIALCGCADSSSESASGPTGEDGLATAAASPWQQIDDSEVMAVPDGELSEAFEAAVAAARSTIAEARGRWKAASDLERPRWAVKWPAPTVDGMTEYVWVEPMHWSRFRVEGRLASPPQRELLCGRELDELVSFAAEEIVDWVRVADELDLEPREGGFTIDALDRPSPPES